MKRSLILGAAGLIAIVSLAGPAAAKSPKPLVTALGVSGTRTPAEGPPETISAPVDANGLQSIIRIGWPEGQPAGRQLCSIGDFLVFTVDANGNRVVPWSFQRIDWSPKHPGDGIALSEPMGPPHNVEQPAGTDLDVHACVSFTKAVGPGSEDFTPVVK